MMEKLPPRKERHMSCIYCGRMFTGTRPKWYCEDHCRWLQWKEEALDLPPTPNKLPVAGDLVIQ